MFKNEVLQLSKDDIRKKISKLIYLSALEEADSMLRHLNTFKKNLSISDKDIEMFNYDDYEGLIDELDDDGQTLYNNLCDMMCNLSTDDKTLDRDSMVDIITENVIKNGGIDACVYFLIWDKYRGSGR